MSLRPDRTHIRSDIDRFMNQVATRGGIVSYLTAGSGAAMDQSQQAVHYDNTPSGAIPLGVLMPDMVNLDLTRQHENWHKEEVQIGGKVTIWNQCQVVTNSIESGITILVGETAYLHRDGQFTNDDHLGGPTVGRFDSTKDQDGFAKVSVNLP